jgi:uroporphyrinogen decarboxylase
MDVKENALQIIHFGTPDRIVTGPPTHNIAYLGANHEGYKGGGHQVPVGTQWTDVWGTVWYRELDGVMGFPRYHPLHDLPKALNTYPWPDPDDPRICGPIYIQANNWDSDLTFLSGSHRETLWEKAYMLVGMEELMVAFYTEPDAVRDLLHHIMNFQLDIAKHYLAAGVEMVGMSDDLGTQRGLLLSPELLETFFIPEYKRLFDVYRSQGVLINFHSCGHIQPLVNMFIDLGVNILNPIQASANNLDKLRAATMGKIALMGGVKSSTIVDGPPEAIRTEVAQRVWQLGRDGGYFCGPDQGMPWSDAHIQALHDAVDELGRYPLINA